MVTLLLASCGSDLFDRPAQAYEEATKELQDAKSDDDCDKIHDKLMQKLHDITVEYPDWEKILSEYEEFYNQYVEYIKKINEGDMSAYADLQEIMTKAQEIDNKVKNANDELSEEQLDKFTELQKKLLEAAKEAGQ